MALQGNAIERPENPSEGNAGGTGGRGYQHCNKQSLSWQGMNLQDGQGQQSEFQNRQADNSDRSFMFEAQVLHQKINLSTGK